MSGGPECVPKTNNNLGKECILLLQFIVLGDDNTILEYAIRNFSIFTGTSTVPDGSIPPVQ